MEPWKEGFKELKGFKKIRLEPGERKTHSFLLGKDELGCWDENMEFSVLPGQARIMVGNNSQDTEALVLEIR